MVEESNRMRIECVLCGCTIEAPKAHTTLECPVCKEEIEVIFFNGEWQAVEPLKAVRYDDA